MNCVYSLYVCVLKGMQYAIAFKRLIEIYEGFLSVLYATSWHACEIGFLK